VAGLALRGAPRVAIAAAALVLAAVAVGALSTASDRREAELGARAFDGRDPLRARVDGHDAPLPAAAVACANCHLPDPGPARASAAGAPPGGGASFGPRLDRASLTVDAARRGGPPSRFDRVSFCRTLRTGEDPAGVLLPRAMPRYEIDDAGCDRLWRHLMRVDPPPASIR
jgi:hypothetical protein